MLSQGRRAVAVTWAQGRMVSKVRTRPGGNLNAAARNGGRVVVHAWAGSVCIYLPGQDRRGNLGALPGAHTSGFHASRFALASRNLELWLIANCVFASDCNISILRAACQL